MKDQATQHTPDKENGSRIARWISKCKRIYNYSTAGVWSDTRHDWRINLIKTINLSVRSFLNGELQNRASALTYQTLLAVVPFLALIFAICRGFGFQNLLEEELLTAFPAQSEGITMALKFVDSYLSQSSEGIFVGVGIGFLLWTLISLISNVEYSFNRIWGIPQGRSPWRKITDYTAVLLILPILMICSSGITVFMSTTIQNNLPFDFLSPIVSLLLDLTSLVMVWLFFAGSYMLIPNTKVKFKNAMIAGVLAGTAFLILQYLFVNGQIYVTRYNAIYGSFSFLPLLLIWMQLVWLITLSGAVYCYSSQNIFEFSFSNEIAKISDDYRWRILMSVMTIIVRRFLAKKPPMSEHQIAITYGLPISLVTASVNRLYAAGMLLRVVIKPGENIYGYVPAIDAQTITMGDVLRKVAENGSSEFIPGFDKNFAAIDKTFSSIRTSAIDLADKTLLSTLDIKLPELKDHKHH